MPGRGFPLMSIGSKLGGGLVGLHDRVGESRPFRYGTYEASGGGMDGISMIEGVREGTSTDGWYDLRCVLDSGLLS